MSLEDKVSAMAEQQAQNMQRILHLEREMANRTKTINGIRDDAAAMRTQITLMDSKLTLIMRVAVLLLGLVASEAFGLLGWIGKHVMGSIIGA